MPEITDAHLKRFVSEVVEAGPAACLPTNLPEEWLPLVLESVEHILASTEEDPTDAMAGGLATIALIALLRAKSPARRSTMVPWKKLREHMNDYRIELALEMVHRHTDIKYEPATLKTIFTKRDVVTWREE